MNVENYFERKKFETDKSFAFLIERCAHTEEAPYGIEVCKKIDSDKPLVLVLSGTAGKDVLRLTNGLLKKVDDFVFNKLHFAKDRVQVAATVCHFGKYFNPDQARQLLYLFYKDYQSYKSQLDNLDDIERLEYISPDYVSDIYIQVFLNRLCDEKQNFLPFEIALQQMKKLIIVAYCHGAYTWMKIEEALLLLLEKSSYSERQKKKLLKSLTVLAYSPDCPLGFSKTQFISLASASDLTLRHGNGFIRYVHRSLFVDDFGLCYWPHCLGAGFYCAQYSKNGVEGNARVFTRVDPVEWYENIHQPKNESKKKGVSEHGFLGFEAVDGMSLAAQKMQKIGATILATALINACLKEPKTLSLFSLIGNHRAFLKANMKGWFIFLKLFFWSLKGNNSSFADNVQFVSID